MSTTEKFDLYQVVTDKIIELLEKGTIPWRKPWLSSGPPMNAISKRPYQGVNLLMLVMLPYDSNFYLTFDQLKKAGGSVNRGEHGHIVVYWEVSEHDRSPTSEPDGEKKQRVFLRYHKV